ncbi:hypothetical protein Bbelb_172290 [Branchiostoma belcheri]|nr:hypothetical protein Bbelb_172290 [Branchiostoma belcheri]
MNCLIRVPVHGSGGGASLVRGDNSHGRVKRSGAPVTPPSLVVWKKTRRDLLYRKGFSPEEVTRHKKTSNKKPVQDRLSDTTDERSRMARALSLSKFGVRAGSNHLTLSPLPRCSNVPPLTEVLPVPACVRRDGSWLFSNTGGTNLVPREAGSLEPGSLVASTSLQRRVKTWSLPSTSMKKRGAALLKLLSDKSGQRKIARKIGADDLKGNDGDPSRGWDRQGGDYHVRQTVWNVRPARALAVKCSPLKPPGPRLRITEAVKGRPDKGDPLATRTGESFYLNSIPAVAAMPTFSLVASSCL